jgi:hypothetical protein
LWVGTKQLHDGLEHCGSENCREASAGIKTVAYRSRLLSWLLRLKRNPSRPSASMPDGALQFLLPAG